jgi:hypothetical protein
VDVNHFSINNSFWINLRENFVSFGWDGLPEDVHITLAFNSTIPDINFHITRNGSDPFDKPKIEIIRINKLFLEKIFPHIVFIVINQILEPFDINTVADEASYFSFNFLERSDNSALIEQKFSEQFQPILKFKKNKTKLKIAGDVESALKEVAISEDMKNIITENITAFPLDSTEELEYGAIISEEGQFIVFRIKGNWFRMKDVKLKELLKEILGEPKAEQLISHIKRSIIRVKNGKRFVDTEPFNNPVIHWK